jgi:hypothetical protein
MIRTVAERGMVAAERLLRNLQDRGMAGLSNRFCGRQS